MLESFTFCIRNHWSITGSAISRFFFWAGRVQNGVGKSEHKEQLISLANQHESSEEQ